MERSDELTADEGLQQSRAKLRRELLPDDPDHFPRSTLMRTLMDPRKQQLILLALSAAGMLLSRSYRARRGGQLVSRIGQLTRSIGRGVWR